MWTYRQRTGELLRDGKHVAYGSSGYDDGDGIPEPGEGKDDPSAQAIRNVGPIPVGRWAFGAPFFHATAGPYSMRLFPLPGTDTHRRSGFLVHGGKRSRGCILLERAIRIAMWESGDHELEVVADSPSEPLPPAPVV